MRLHVAALFIVVAAGCLDEAGPDIELEPAEAGQVWMTSTSTFHRAGSFGMDTCAAGACIYVSREPPEGVGMNGTSALTGAEIVVQWDPTVPGEIVVRLQCVSESGRGCDTGSTLAQGRGAGDVHIEVDSMWVMEQALLVVDVVLERYVPPAESPVTQLLGADDYVVDATFSWAHPVSPSL